MLAKDSTGRSVQVLHPMDDGALTIAPTAGSAGKNVTAFKAFTVAIGVRVRSAEKVRVKLGDNAVVAADSDLPISDSDGWVYLSLEGKDATGADKAKATHLSVLAGSIAASVDIIELN